MEIAVIILSIVTLLLIFVSINLFRKNEAMEAYVNELEESNERYESFYAYMKRTVDESYSRIKQIDRVGSFQADDETGWIFKTLKEVIKQLNEQF